MRTDTTMSPNSSRNKAEPTSYCASLQQIKPTSKVLFTPKCPDKSPADLSLIHSAQSDAPNSLASNDTNMSRHAPVIVDSPEHVAPDQVPGFPAPIPLIPSRDFAEFARIVGLAQDEPERLPAKIHRLEEELDAAVNQLQLASMVARDIYKFNIRPFDEDFQKTIRCLTDERKLHKLVSRLEIVRNATKTPHEISNPSASIATRQIQLNWKPHPILKSIDSLPPKEINLKTYATFAVQQLSRDKSLTEKNVQALFQQKYPRVPCTFSNQGKMQWTPFKHAVIEGAA